MNVTFDSVSKTFGAVRAVSNVSVTFRGGRVSVLLGANGSGKSTMLQLVGRVASPTSGRVVHTAWKSAKEVRSQLGWVGHESMCYGDLSARENVRLSATLRGVNPEHAWTEAKVRFALERFSERPVRLLSRGQQQRVALARSLVHQPLLILLDEPTGGLDAKSVETLSSVIREESSRGALVVVVTHDQGFADRVGDDVYVMLRGRLSAG